MWNHIMRRPDIALKSKQAPSFHDDKRPLWVWGSVAATLSLMLASAAAWITHVVVCIKASAWILLAFGCIVAPIGVVHGVGVWLGLF